jgi:lactoylglutathione lyase
MRLAWTILYVPDVPTTLAFYEAAFGLPRRFLHEGNDYAELETGGTALAFAGESLNADQLDFVRNRPDQRPAGAEVAFVTDDVEAAYARAVTAGAVGVVPPTAKPWGQIVSYVRDCNGFLVELCTAVG